MDVRVFGERDIISELRSEEEKIHPRFAHGLHLKKHWCGCCVDADEKMRCSHCEFHYVYFVVVAVVSHLMCVCIVWKFFSFQFSFANFSMLLLVFFVEIVTIHLWIHKPKLHNLKSCKLMQSMQMRTKNSTRQKLWNATFRVNFDILKISSDNWFDWRTKESNNNTANSGH